MDSYILCRNTQKQNENVLCHLFSRTLTVLSFWGVATIFFINQHHVYDYMIQPTRTIEFYDNDGYGSRTRFKGTPEIAGWHFGATPQWHPIFILFMVSIKPMMYFFGLSHIPAFLGGSLVSKENIPGTELNPAE